LRIGSADDMPAEEVLAQRQGADRRALGALLFIASMTNAMDVYSALNSSPWTAESFGADPDKARACMEYVWHSIAVTSATAVAAAMIAESWWPVVGMAVADAYMYWLYRRALGRAQARGSTSWDTALSGKAAG